MNKYPYVVGQVFEVLTGTKVGIKKVTKTGGTEAIRERREDRTSIWK